VLWDGTWRERTDSGDSILIQVTDRAGHRRVAFPLNGASEALDYIEVSPPPAATSP